MKSASSELEPKFWYGRLETRDAGSLAVPLRIHGWGFSINRSRRFAICSLSMTPAARITAALLLGVIVVSLGYLFQGYAGGSEELLFNGEMLQPREADHIEAAIAKAGPDGAAAARRADHGAARQKTAYLAAIADAGALPANFDTLLEESLDTGMFESGETRSRGCKAARERQLSMMISMMDGVEDAKVLYDIREPQAFRQGEDHRDGERAAGAGDSDFGPQQMKLIREAVARRHRRA